MSERYKFFCNDYVSVYSTESSSSNAAKWLRLLRAPAHWIRDAGI